jgi:hypothetical protein
MTNLKNQFTETMKVKATKNSTRAKEDAAVNQAMYIARRSKTVEANSTISQIKAITKDNKLAAKTTPAPRFSGKSAYGVAYGTADADLQDIKNELALPRNTKTRIAKLNQLLIQAEAKCAKANSIYKSI